MRKWEGPLTEDVTRHFTMKEPQQQPRLLPLSLQHEMFFTIMKSPCGISKNFIVFEMVNEVKESASSWLVKPYMKKKVKQNYHWAAGRCICGARVCVAVKM